MTYFITVAVVTPFVLCQSWFLEAQLVRQEEGKLKNTKYFTIVTFFLNLIET